MLQCRFFAFQIPSLLLYVFAERRRANKIFAFRKHTHIAEYQTRRVVWVNRQFCYLLILFSDLFDSSYFSRRQMHMSTKNHMSERKSHLPRLNQNALPHPRPLLSFSQRESSTTNTNLGSFVKVESSPPTTHTSQNFHASVKSWLQPRSRSREQVSKIVIEEKH